LTPDTQKNDSNILDRITFTNKLGKKVYLSEIADIAIEPNDKSINYFDGLPTLQIMGDVGGSAQYPMKNILERFKAEEFWE
jgi:multidrug efflux pump subunit AcrB